MRRSPPSRIFGNESTPTRFDRADVAMSQHERQSWTTLSPADAEAVDAALMGGAGAGQALSLSNRPRLQDDERGRKVLALLDLIGRCPTDEPSADLVQRTMAAVVHARQRERFQRQVRMLAAAPQRLSVLDIAAVAAVVVAAVSLLWPAMSTARNEARRVACANNLSAAGAALGAFAADNGGQMPRYANQAGTPWYQVGEQARDAYGPIRSNSAQLYLLVRRGYIQPQALACPENPNAPRRLSPEFFDWPSAEAVSYSYQNQYTPVPTQLEQNPGLAVLADKNPLIVIPPPRPGQSIHFVFRQDLPANTPSSLHGVGQNILRADGQVSFSAQPILPNGDNIWLVDGVESYVGKESPQPGDSHLVP